jgi:hypothetical protein
MVKSHTNETKTKAQAVVQQLNELVEKRTQWEQNEYARSNVSLYEIISSIKKRWEQVENDKALRAETVKQMRELLVSQGVRIQMNTKALTLFVRFVFRTDRQRAMNYSRALEAAIAEGISADNLASFIESKGGIEECKRLVPKTAAAVEKKLAIDQAMQHVEETLQDAVMSPLATFTVPQKMVKGLAENYVLVIAKANDQGEVRALATVPVKSPKQVEWAKKQIAIFVSNEAKIAQKNAQKSELDSSVDAAIGLLEKKSPTVNETVGDLITT